MSCVQFTQEVCQNNRKRKLLLFQAVGNVATVRSTWLSWLIKCGSRKFVQLATPVTVCAVRKGPTSNEKPTHFRKVSASIQQYGESDFTSPIWHSFVFLRAARSSRSLHVAPRSTDVSRQKWIAIICRVPRKYVHHFITLRGRRKQIKTVSEIRQR